MFSSFNDSGQNYVFYSDSCHHSTFAHCKMPGIVLIQFYFLLVAMKLNTIFYGIICAVGREEFFNEWREALTLGSAVVSFYIVCMIVQPRLLRAKSFCLIKRHWINFKWPQKEGVYTQGFRDHLIIILINELPYSGAWYLILNGSTKTMAQLFHFHWKRQHASEFNSFSICCYDLVFFNHKK